MVKKIEFIKKKKDIICISLLFLLVLHMLFYIFVGSKSLMNSDSTFVVDFSKEQLITGKFFPRTWANTNDFWVYSLIPIITVFIKLGMKLFVARQFAVAIQSMLLLIATFDLYKRFLKNKNGGLAVIFLLLCGVSGQFLFEVFGDATYGSIIFYSVIELWLFLKYLNSKKIIYIMIFSFLLIFITACSLRFPINIGAPLICCILALVYDEKIKKEYIISFIAIVGSIGVGYIFHNILCNHLIMNAAYNSSILSNSDELNKGLNSVLFNYLTLIGSTGLNTYSLTTYKWNSFITKDSPFIVLTFIQCIFSILLLICPYKLLKKRDEMTQNENVLLTYTLSLLIIIFFFLIIGKMSEWYRYITPVVFMLILLLPLFYKYYMADSNKNKIVATMVFIMVCCSSLIFSINSYYDLDKKQMRTNPSQGLADFLIDKNLTFGYRYSGGEHNLFYTLTNGKLRITVLSPDGKPYYWLNSTDWFYNNNTKGDVFFLRKKYDNHLNYEDKSKKIYTYDDWEIIVFDDIKTITNNF